ncbi:MAG: 30S ribosomal protein S20 [Dehalococcoidales bacterium]|nr:30S ribosomal protein S20 [Dehalococcoidales bacterium]
MGNKSAQKAARAAGRRTVRNKSNRSQLKTEVARAEQLIAAGDAEAAKGAVATAVSSLDKAAQKKMVHANNAARRKSRLLNKVNQAAAKPKAAKKEEE